MCDLRAIAAWFIGEAAALGRSIREPQLWIALGCGLALWSLAYQAPYSYTIDIGGNQQTLRQHDDDPYLSGFNSPEPAKLYIYKQHDRVPFRWTTDESTITIPGLGGDRWNVALKAASGRPDKTAALSRWSDGTITLPVTVGARQEVYRFAAHVDQAGDLTLVLDTPAFEAPADPRALGIVLFQITVGQDAGPHLPAPRQLALLATALALAYLLLRRLAVPARLTLAGALALAVAGTALLLRERTTLTLIAPRLPLILAGGFALTLVLDLVAARLIVFPYTLRRGALSPHTARMAVIGLIVLALTLRLGGILHPHARSSDDGLNTNNLIGFIHGEVFFTEGLPAESGGGPAPYPPGEYITFAPTQLLIPGGFQSYRIYMRIANALWDSLTVGLLWYLLRRSGYQPRTALFGAALYVLPPPMLASLSVGEFANMFGQGMALLLVSMLALHARDLHRPRQFAIGLAVLALPLLSHLGITISLICLLGYLVLIWMIRPEHRRAALALVGAGLIVGGVLALLYYAAFGDILAARFGQPASLGVDTAAPTLAQKLGNQLRLADKLGIEPLLVALGATGAIFTSLRPRGWRLSLPRPSLGSLLMAWWGGTFLSLGLLVFASQGVRWQAFFYPALCLGAGPACGQLWRRGRAGRALALGLIAFVLWNGLAFWVNQIQTYSP
jgi:hypothetical protein